MTDSRKPDARCMHEDVLREWERICDVLREMAYHRSRSRSPIPAQPSPEQERDVDKLLEDFQRACERCVSHLASDEGYARTDAKNRAILRNELRSRLLSVVSPPADTGDKS